MITVGSVAKKFLVLLVTVAVFSFLAIKLEGKNPLTDLAIVDIFEIFIAIPVLTLVYYWLISDKVGEFEARLESIEKTFIKLEKEFEVDEKEMEDEESDLKTEEGTLKGDIRELKGMLRKLDKDVQLLRKRK